MDKLQKVPHPEDDWWRCPTCGRWVEIKLIDVTFRNDGGEELDLIRVVGSICKNCKSVLVDPNRGEMLRDRGYHYRLAIVDDIYLLEAGGIAK